MQLVDQITNFLSLYEAEVYNLANSIRYYLLNNLPNINEQLDVKAKIIAYGYGSAYKDNICNILLSKTGVKLGFNRGAELPDPSGLLEGSGKVHKYIVIKAGNDIKSPALKKLLIEAIKAYKIRKSSI